MNPTSTSGEDSFAHARRNANSNCLKCKGTGQYMYDHNHGTICDLCCKHDKGRWHLQEHYGAKNGKWCCLAGCGMLWEEREGGDPLPK